MTITRYCRDPDMGISYILGEPGSPCILIDCGDNRLDALEEKILQKHGSCLGIFLTHGHMDHIAGLAEWKDKKVPIFIHEDDVPCLFDPRLNASGLFAQRLCLPDDLNLYPFDDEDEIVLGPFALKAIATPFHTAGSSCFYFPNEGLLFSGDTLFHLGIGRSDLPGAKPRLAESSLRKLLSLPKETKVYPGHGRGTSIENEMRFNPALLALQ